MSDETLEAALTVVAFLLTFLIPVRGVSIPGHVRLAGQTVRPQAR
ncbi:hypothetical protein [Brevundimonas sp.]|nr:hypothetical protein [Brevundimonas sp.]HYD27719.1 hypothetical protein [Brevundimonas sp.]